MWVQVMGTREASEQTKKKLVEAAGEMFARVGFDGANVRQIAAKAGVAFGMIAYHFGGKEGLYRAALREACRPVEDLGMIERQLATLPAREALREIVRVVVRDAVCESVDWRHQLIDRECHELTPSFREFLVEHWAPELRMLCTTLAKAAGVEPEGDAVMLAALELYQGATTLMTYRDLIDLLTPGLVQRVRESDQYVDRLVDVAVFAAQHGRESER